MTYEWQRLKKDGERRTEIDQRGWCARWTIKLGVRDRVSASQSSTAWKFTAGLTLSIPIKHRGSAAVRRPLTEAADQRWWRITAKNTAESKESEMHNDANVFKYKHIEIWKQEQWDLRGV